MFPVSVHVNFISLFLSSSVFFTCCYSERCSMVYTDYLLFLEVLEDKYKCYEDITHSDDPNMISRTLSEIVSGYKDEDYDSDVSNDRSRSTTSFTSIGEHMEYSTPFITINGIQFNHLDHGDDLISINETIVRTYVDLTGVRYFYLLDFISAIYVRRDDTRRLTRIECSTILTRWKKQGLLMDKELQRRQVTGVKQMVTFITKAGIEHIGSSISPRQGPSNKLFSLLYESGTP
jgi:hypothetical protein